MKEKSQGDSEAKIVTEAVAAQAMWDYFKEHKPLLSDIREYRDLILEQLMLGNSAARVFGKFLRVPDPVPLPCKSTSARKVARTYKHARASWPFSAH